MYGILAQDYIFPTALGGILGATWPPTLRRQGRPGQIGVRPSTGAWPIIVIPNPWSLVLGALVGLCMRPNTNWVWYAQFDCGGTGKAIFQRFFPILLSYFEDLLALLKATSGLEPPVLPVSGTGPSFH